MKLSTRTRWILAALITVVGLAWMGQGTGLFGGSGPMDGSTFWAIVGAGLVVIGVVIGWTAFRTRRQV